MNVLSLFDGISCGQIALERAGVTVEQYLASEIDVNAIAVTQQHYPKTIQLGDIRKINGSDLPEIDLVIGGSPCQGFSFAGKQLNFKDDRSQLFFEYTRLLKECNPRFFLLENVRMKKEYQNIISQVLGVEPIALNSSLFSKQQRQRLYWTNIPILPIEPKKECNFDGYLYRLGHGYIHDEIKFFKKYPSLAAQSPATKYRIIVDLQKAQGVSLKELRHNGEITRCATPEECEEFQTLPFGYTSKLKKTHRYKVIGNGWTVDVVSHIFRGMKFENQSTR